MKQETTPAESSWWNKISRIYLNFNTTKGRRHKKPSPLFTQTVMKKFLLLLFLLGHLPANADKWQGQSGSRRFYVETDYTVAGTFLTIPELWINRAACNLLRSENDSLFMTFTPEELSMQAAVLPDSCLSAHFIVYGENRDLTLFPVDSLQPHQWAENPVPPYPYTEEEISISVSDSVVLAGTLTLPPGRRRVPAVIILSGTGQQNRDAEFSGHRPFARIADYLSRRGIAVLRLDDRGTGKSTGIYADATTDDFARDALRAVETLKKHKAIRSSKIGLMGHSEGGAAATMAAAASTDVAFLITLAGVCTDGLTSLRLQNDAIIDTYPGYSDVWRRVNKEFLHRLFAWVYEIPLSQPLEPALREKYETWISAQNDSTLQMLGLKGREDMYLLRYLRTADTRWHRELMHYDPTDFLPKIKVPVLALNGDMDIMVPSKAHLAVADSLLRKSGNRHYHIVELPGLNHLFQHCKTCLQNEIPELPEVFAEEALEAIYDFFVKEVF